MPSGLRGGVPTHFRTLFATGPIGDLSDGALLERFLAARDEAAFEALLLRHGPMVLHVCRGKLVDPDEIDDAFQTVFLILLRRAGSIRSRASVASWLFGVATRVSERIRVDASRRRRIERNAAEVRPPEAAISSDDHAESLGLLHEELDRLPARYREALVLYYLEGLTCEAAAATLRRPVGTVKARLSRARGILKQRLTRRGVALPAGLLGAGAFSETASAAAVSTGLLNATIATAVRFRARPECVPVRVLSLVKRVLMMMFLQKLKLAAILLVPVVLLAGTVLLGSASSGRARTAESRLEEEPQSPPAKPAAPSDAMFHSSDPVDRALRDALPPALSTADPYRFTFALIGLAKGRSAAGDHDAALATVRLADQIARTVKNPHHCKHAVMRIAVARGRIGDKAPARAALEAFAREAEGLTGQARIDLMSTVIDSLDEAGFTDEAKARLKAELAIVEAIGDERFKEGGVYRLLFNQINLGDFEGALRAAEQYTDKKSNYRASLLGDVVRYRGARGAAPRKIVERARELAQEVTYPYPRAMAECEIAAALAREGDIAGALALARGLGKGYGGLFADSIRDEAIAPLAQIALVQHRAGDRAGAKATLQEALAVAQESNGRNNGILYERLRKVLDAQREIGDVTRAKATADFITESNFERTLALASLSRAQARSNDLAAARATLREAQELAREVGPIPNLINDDPAANADLVFREVTLAQADTGDVPGALETIRSHGSDDWKSEALAGVVDIQARRGDFAGAVLTARAISRSDLAGEARYSIAGRQARERDPATALAWASHLDSPDQKAFALVGIAEGTAWHQVDARKSKSRKP
jgi:RNA polymerase sigma factor (sigma-70 family)